MPDEMEEIINDFVTETQEMLDGLDEKFVQLEKDGSNTDLLNEIFRGVHTIKGAAGFLGFNQIVDVAHKTENILKKLKDGLMAPEPAVMDVILRAVDLLKVLLEHVRTRDGKEEDISAIIAELDAVNEGEPAPPATPEPVAGAPEDGDKVHEGMPEPQPAPPGEDTRKEQQSPPRSEETKKERATEQTIRVDVERLDTVLNLVGELVLGRNRLMKLVSRLEAIYPSDEITADIAEAMAFMDVTTTDLQLAVMKTRMQPVKKVFSRFPRMVRDLSRTRGKEVELVIHGEETELDKSIIEEIGDPLVHLIRNAIDHGIEPPEEREKTGKTRKGTLTLAASQQGNHIVLSISDDGRGIDTDRLRTKLQEKGMLSAEEAEAISDTELLEYIFMPGVSTASAVSDISGRGVGMDVVKTNIGKLNGYIDIRTEKGKGTTFNIKLPLTLAIIQVLMVEVRGNIFAIPLSTVIETLREESSDIYTVKGQEVIKLRGEVIPVVRVGDVLGLGMKTGNGAGKVYLVVVAVGERKFAVLVDRLHGQEEVVIKSIEGRVSASDGIAGATVTGDGQVVLILDMSMMMMKLIKSTFVLDR